MGQRYGELITVSPGLERKGHGEGWGACVVICLYVGCVEGWWWWWGVEGVGGWGGGVVGAG